MKIRVRYINENTNKYTNPGEYVYYRDTLLKCVETKGDCVGCFFNTIDEDGDSWCLLDHPESEYYCFDCISDHDNNCESVKFIEV